MSRSVASFDPALLDGRSANGIARWLRWQAPYVAFCCGYFPVTMVNRLLRRSKRAYVGLDPVTRRLRDKWGFLPSDVRSMSHQRPIWINIDSAGEVVNGWGVLKRLPIGEGPYVLSTQGYDSYDLLRRAYGQDRVFFAPWDLALSTRRDLRALRPRALVLFQNAYFPVLLREARRAGTATILVNGLLSRNVYVGNPAIQRALALGFYRELDAVSVQSEEDYIAFRQLGVPADRLTITGNLAAGLSHLRLTPAERYELRGRLKLRERDPVMIVGSAPAGERKVMTEAFNELRRRVPETRFIVAPRWIHEAGGVTEWLRAQGFRVARRSDLDPDEQERDVGYDVLVLDTFGELPTLYGVADVAFIGSSLVPINERRGGHNPLEPLAHGVVPLFGPHMNLWPSVVAELRKAWPAIQVDSAQALAARVADVLTGRAPVSAIRAVGARLIDRSSGAVERTVEFLRRHLDIENAP